MTTKARSRPITVPPPIPTKSQLAARQGPPQHIALSPKLEEVLNGIADSTLRDQVEGTVRFALAALHELGRIHLPQDHFEVREQETIGTDQHLEVAPYVLAAIAAVNRLLAYMVDVFPAPPESDGEDGDDDAFGDFDLEFDLVDGPTGEGGLASQSEEKQAMTPAEQVADAANAYGFMLRSRVLDFAERLEVATAKDDSWALLGELDDYKHRLAKSGQGLLFGILAIFPSAASREEIYPQYRSAVGEGIDLRRAIADLSYQIGRFNDSLSDQDLVVPLIVAVADHLARFSGQPIYRSLRAEDKRAVIDFRRDLYQIRHPKEGETFSMVRLKRAVEGFSKFLESMHAINHREVLVLHDRAILERELAEMHQALTLVHTNEAAARFTLDKVVEKVVEVLGRNPDLDDAIRAHRAGGAGDEELGPELNRWLGLLQGTLATCG